MKRHKIKRIFILAVVLLLVFISTSLYITTLRTEVIVEESIANQSLTAAQSIASAMDIDTYEQFLNNPVRNEHYWAIRNYLNDAREKIGALYVYTLEIDNPKVSKSMIVGGPKEVVDKVAIGEVCTVPEEQVAIAYYKEKSYVTKLIEDFNYDSTYLSVGAPIKNKDGQVIGYLGIDISAETMNEIKLVAIENNLFLLFINSIFIFIVITSFWLLQRWYQKEVATEVGYTEDTYQNEIKTLIASVSSLRHDFTNHIQVMHGLLQIEAVDEAEKYVNALYKEAQAIESIKLNIDHPGLSILLQTKKLAAQNHQIEMDITAFHHAFDQLKTTDLIKILSNLIDNAMDATLELPEHERKIAVICEANDTHYIFKIMNTGPNIVDWERIFHQGYTTKKEQQGKERGQGLFIVKEIVHKYDGHISIESTGPLETTAIVEIPLK
ncbi:GHKL domain-containing protein [Lysinibacillus sp. KU-BSD001]|uniref:GHKL domain-containing protein n=1 Tax=Lysinibacillus sp. KU-BSD001 TaxID=3141328 RepID=UPI0036E28BA1